MSAADATAPAPAAAKKYAAATPRLWLQALSVEDHLQDYHSLYSDPNSLAWSTRTPSSSLSSSRDAMISRFPSAEKPFLGIYAIYLRPDADSTTTTATASAPSPSGQNPPFAGLVGITRQSADGVPEIGYRLRPEFFGKGLATEALKGFVDMFWGLEGKENVRRMAAMTDIRNVASGRVMAKVGATRTGTEILDLETLGKCEMVVWSLERPEGR